MSSSPQRPGRPDTFCVLPWVHLEIMPFGTSKICCVAQEQVTRERVPIRISEMPLEQVRQSSYMRSIRSALADGRRIPACTHCWQQEDRGETSYRQLWNERRPEAAALVRERIRQGQDVREALPVEYIQISLGNKCNLACRMCNAGYSSRIAADPVHSQWSPSGDIASPAADASQPARAAWDAAAPWFEQEEFLRGDLLERAGSLRLLVVTGGEPLLSTPFLDLLKEYVARGRHRELALRINSNLFHNEARIRDVMSSLLNFWYCSVGASVDGFGSVYEYVRHPARWDIVSRNIRLMRELAERHSNLIFSLDTVVQPYNCLSLVDLMRFADEVGVECSAQVIEHPHFLTMQVVPRDLRLLAAQRLRAYAETPAEPGTRATNRAHAGRIARHFELIEDDGDTERVRQSFVAFTQALDQARRQDLRATVPELAEALLPRVTPAAQPPTTVAPPKPRRGFLRRLRSIFG